MNLFLLGFFSACAAVSIAACVWFAMKTLLWVAASILAGGIALLVYAFTARQFGHADAYQVFEPLIGGFALIAFSLVLAAVIVCRWRFFGAWA